MNNTFIRVAAATPAVRVADPRYNAGQIIESIAKAHARGAKLIVFPELALTAYTCQDLFFQQSLLDASEAALREILAATGQRYTDILVFLGLPWSRGSKLYNCAAAIKDGRLLGLVPKRHIPNYSEFYEARYFTPGNETPVYIPWDNGQVPMGANLLFNCTSIPNLVISAEICEDVWVPSPPSITHAMAGATLIVNCSASDETTGKDAYRESLICGQSARLVCGYVYANAGDGESTQDLVFGGQNIIAENGTCLIQSRRFVNETVFADMDLERLANERRRMTTFPAGDELRSIHNYTQVDFTYTCEAEDTNLVRSVDPFPFVPGDPAGRNRRCEEILSIQALGLKKRLEHIGCKDAVIGISGGLDSTLALLVTVRAFDMLNIPRERIHCITMPCFGTTDRTYANACAMTKEVGASLTEINIRNSVTAHFEDIGQSLDNHDVTFENGQARERTQVLMDVANQVNGLVVGTGDMSELALGWATYNGDHMSMYGVNASVPKTLVRHLVGYYADTCGEEALSAVLHDVLDTPVSPELLPPKDGQIAQKTEDLVGPYELHDFFLYYILRFGYAPTKIYRMAVQAFTGQYEGDVIYKWLRVFYRRFFSQQFKRSCLPDGPKVGSVALSPRGDLRMPSDACSRVWLEELDTIQIQEKQS